MSQIREYNKQSKQYLPLHQLVAGLETGIYLLEKEKTKDRYILSYDASPGEIRGWGAVSTSGRIIGFYENMPLDAACFYLVKSLDLI